MSDLAAALMVAIRVHARQVDKQGEPYLLHVLRVLEAVPDEAKAVAALHDVVEDGGDEGRRLVLGLDLTAKEGCALRLLTHEPQASYTDYIWRLAADRSTWTEQHATNLAREVKLADLRDNLGRIPTQVPCEPCCGTGSFWPDLRPCVECQGSGKKAAGPEWCSLRARYESAIAALEDAA